MSDNRRNATLKALIDAAITELMIKTSGEQIYLDDNTTLSSKMAEMVTAINLRDKKTDVDAKIKTVTDSLNSTSESLGNAISTLRSEKADKTEVTERITALKQEIMGDLPVEAYDTFTELAAYIEEHQEAADALTAAVGNKADKTVVNDILTVINGLGALANKDKVAKDDLDASLKTELDAKATTEAMNTALSTKSNTSHTHDDRYYTKAETDTAIANAPKGDTGVWISQADYDALSDEDKALDLNYYIYDAKSDSDSSGISISQAEYNNLSEEEKNNDTTYYIYDADTTPTAAATIPFSSENYTATSVGGALEEVRNMIYPVGSIYMSVNNINPANLFGGTWERIKDKFLLSAGDSYTAGTTGGEATHILTVDEMPSHSHKSMMWGENSGNYFGVNTDNGGGNWRFEYTNNVSGANFYTNRVGGSQPHNNMPPYLVVYVWQRTA